ncbi:cell wall protein DAN4 [Agrilus planipennis]|uniref:Cell wall protein DAN4 n=1 Tax=Agrilus planipennis TaxID=224129 RepID=A0A1W4X8G9_AGRPL|nr:cell wall protein DAN4 [Agrilus planipennis]
MRVTTVVVIFVLWNTADGQLWKLPEELLNSFPWFRQAKAGEGSENTLPTSSVSTPPSLSSSSHIITTISETASTTKKPTSPGAIATKKVVAQKTTATVRTNTTKRNNPSSKLPPQQRQSGGTHAPVTTQKILSTAQPSTKTSTATILKNTKSSAINSSSTTSSRKSSGTWTTASTAQVKNTTQAVVTSSTDFSTLLVESTTPDSQGTTIESRDNHRVHHFYMSKHEKPQVKIVSNISQNLLPLPADASAALVKPTKYHYYPHNQHIYLLPECAIQQVCNAVYVRLNWTQPLCACPSRYRDPCSASLNSDDQHTTELLTNQNQRKALTLVKTCEPTTEMRICRSPRDWSLLALQNIRTGKSHYLVICRCPETSFLDGPMSHNQPTYASVPGIRVYGMMCVQQTARRDRTAKLFNVEDPKFPWQKVKDFAKTVQWE